MGPYAGPVINVPRRAMGDPGRVLRTEKGQYVVFLCLTMALYTELTSCLAPLAAAFNII